MRVDARSRSPRGRCDAEPAADMSPELLPDSLPRGCDPDLLYSTAEEMVDSLFTSAGINDPAHNMEHVRAVTEHVKSAAKGEKFNEVREATLVLAALLHEVDDDKLLPTENYANARAILTAVLPGSWRATAACAEQVVEIIDLVSAKRNKHRGVSVGSEWKLIVRDADRIEAIGEVGIARCFAYNRKVGTPLFLDTTPRATTEEELWRIATPERFAAYHTSVSMIDHYYDKLLHLEHCASGCAYLQEQMRARLQILIAFVLEFGKTGEVDVPRLEGLKRKHCLKKPVPVAAAEMGC